MEASYRRSLIAQEVLGYNADIVCLQEVDEKAFFTYFLPVMQHAGAASCALACSAVCRLILMMQIFNQHCSRVKQREDLHGNRVWPAAQYAGTSGAYVRAIMEGWRDAIGGMWSAFLRSIPPAGCRV